MMLPRVVAQIQASLLIRRTHAFSSNSKNCGNEATISNVRRYSIIMMGVGATLVGVGVARVLYDRLLDNHMGENLQDAPRRDASHATVRLQIVPATASENKQLLQLQKLRSAYGNGSAVILDAQQFAIFVKGQRELLHAAAERDRKRAAENLRQELSKATAEADSRVTAFCDWYLSYPTTYKLLGIATAAAVKHAVKLRDSKETSLAQVVTRELQVHVEQKYDAIVLRPARTDPQLHLAFVRSLQKAHEDYLQAIAALETDLARFVQEHSLYTGIKPHSRDVVVDLDWASQRQKVEHVPLVYEKSPGRAVALVTAGAATGKLAGTASTVSAAKALAAKLAAPLASKATATAVTGKAATGGAAGAFLGGPVGAAAGAALGVGVDMSVNAAAGFLQRSTLEQDVRESLKATVSEWEELVLRPELHRVQSVWYGKAEQLLAMGDGDYNDKIRNSGAASPRAPFVSPGV